MTTLDDNIKEELWSPTMSSVSSVPELDDDVVSEPRSPLSPRTPGFVQDSGAGSEWTQVDKDSWHEPAGKEQGSTASVAFRPNSPPRSYRRRSNASISKSYANGTIMLVVEDAEYTVDRVLLRGLSSRLTEAMREAPDDDPVELLQVKKEDAEILIDVLTNKRFAEASLTFEECDAILRFSAEWPLDELHDIAVRRMDELLATNAVRRIRLGRDHGIQDWIDQGLGELSVRKDPPSLVEAQSMEKSDLLFLARVRPLALASNEDDAHFHWRFGDRVPKNERLLTWYRCALRTSILLQGCMYVTKRYLCFHSRNLGQTYIIIPVADIVSMEKRNTWKMFPNGLTVNTKDEQHIFASLTNRDATLELLWDLRRFI